MKRTVLVLFTFIFSINAHAVLRYTEGEDYVKISNTASSEPRLTEYFSFFCPHCYRFEKSAELIKQDLPGDVEFIQSHVDTTGLAPFDIQNQLSLALAVIDRMKLGKAMKMAIFKEIHQSKKRDKNGKKIPFRTIDQLREVFAANGVDGAKFDKAMRNINVKADARRMKKAWQSIPANIRRIGVPSLVVNDQYWINTAKFKSREEFKAIIGFLLNLNPS